MVEHSIGLDVPEAEKNVPNFNMNGEVGLCVGLLGFFGVFFCLLSALPCNFANWLVYERSVSLQ